MKKLRVEGKPSLENYRETAIRTARYYLRQQGVEMNTATPDQALAVLDDLNRADRHDNYQATRWYRMATDNQIKLFKREWQKNV